jgi:hypothetical protein
MDYWCNNVTGSDITGDGSEGNPWASIRYSVNQIAALTPSKGHRLLVVNAGTVYTETQATSIGVAFDGEDYDTDWGIIIEGYPQTSWPTLKLATAALDFFDFQAGCDYVIFRNLKWTTSAISGLGFPFEIGWQAEHVRIECQDWGTLPYHSPYAIHIVGTGDRRVDLEVRCCYWEPDGQIPSGWQRMIQYSDGTDAIFWIHHCVLRDSEVGISVSGNTAGTLTVEHCTFDNMERVLSTGAYNSTGTIVFRNNIYSNISLYVYYCGVAITPGTLTTYNNCYYNVTDYCNHATCATCGITVPSSGDLLRNPDYVGGPAWEWAYGLILPTNLTPQDQPVLTGSTGAGAMGAIDPYVEAPCHCAKPVPAAPCLPWDITSCNYESFSGIYPSDWQLALAKPVIPPILLVVCYDPDGENLQLTPLVKSARPIGQGRDIIFGAYKGRDTDVEFVDPTGRLDPRDPDSELYQKAWYGKFVDVGAWIEGTSSVLRLQRYFLADARPTTKGTTIWRLNDIFAWLIRGEVRANSVGNFEVSNGGTIDETKCSCDQTVCRQQTWTVTFTTGTDFQVEGSLVGLDGIGTTGSDFTSTSGSVSILSTFWGGSWGLGDTVTFKTGVRYTAKNVVQAAKDMLLNLADIPEDWLELSSWSDLEAKSTAYKITYWGTDATDPLRILRFFMRHRFATAYPNEEGKIAVMTFEPDPSQFVSRCVGKRAMLMELSPEHLSILNVISCESGHGDEAYPTTGASYPAPGQPNESIDRYLTEFPYRFTLRGYVSADYSTIYGICQQLYVSRAGLPYNPRQLFKGKVKIQEMNMRIGEVIYVDSAVPSRLAYALVVDYKKDIFNRRIDLQLLDVSDVIEPPAGCGYAECGGVGTTDDCWVYG